MYRSIYSFVPSHPAWLLIFYGVLAGLLSACEEEASAEQETKSFVRIYDNSLFNATVDPIDIIQTSDGGYLILSDRELVSDTSAYEYRDIYLVKVDSMGNFVKELTAENPYVHPVGRLMEEAGAYYFFCMNENTVGTQLAKVDVDAEALTYTAIGQTYPLACAKDGSSSNFILLSYDHLNTESVLSVITPSGGVSSSVSISIGVGDNDHMDELLIEHFSRNGKHFPFQVGHVPGSVYFFNGIVDYTLSLVFTNFNADSPEVGKISGNQEDAGMNMLVNLGSTRYAYAWFNFNDNYLVPDGTINPGATSNITDMGGFSLPEVVSNAHIEILNTTIGEQSVLIFATDTRSNQIVLYFYDETNGTFLGSKYLGYSNPFEVANLVSTDDGGLAVCGRTYLAGRFSRIALFKISEEELREVLP